MKRLKNSNVAVIIVTCNQKDVTRKTLELLRKQTMVSDIIVIDNASTDGTKEDLECEFPEVTVLRAKNNYGGSGGQYVGTRYAYEKGYEWIIMSDNDAFPISEDLIEELVKNASSRVVTQPWNIDEDIEGYSEFWPMHYACYHRNIFKESGFPLFEYFLYGDDGEFFERIKSSGIKAKKICSVFYSHPMKRSYLPSRLYFNYRNWLNIFYFYGSLHTFFIKFFLFLNSLFIYKIVGENDYYRFGMLGIRNFLRQKNDNSPIGEKSEIFSSLASLKTEEFVKIYGDAFINVHKKTNVFLKSNKNAYGKVKQWKHFSKLLQSEVMVSESVINTEVFLYSFFFNRKLVCIDDITAEKVFYRQYDFPFFWKKLLLLFLYNIRNISVFSFLCLFFLKKKSKKLSHINTRYNLKDLEYFYET